MGIKFPFYKIGRVVRMEGDACTTRLHHNVSAQNRHRAAHREMREMVMFTSCVFYHDKKNKKKTKH